MREILLQPWPWYVAGPLIGLIVPLLLMLGGKPFGISSNLRHMCAATVPCGLPFFTYDWKRQGGWNLLFALGIVLGGFVAARWMLPDGYAAAISAATQNDLHALGLGDLSGLVPAELFGWSAPDDHSRMDHAGAGRLPGRVRLALGRRLHVRSCDLGPRGASTALTHRRDRILRRWSADDALPPAAHLLSRHA